MKTFVTLRRLALGLLVLGGSLAAVAPRPTTLGGHLDHAPAADSVRLTYGAHRTTAPLSAAGDFKFVLPELAQPVRATFFCGDQRTYLWLTPGDRLRLTLDFPKFDESLRYRGRGAAVNNYLARALYRFEFDAPGQVAKPYNHITASTVPADYRQQEDAYRQQQVAFLNAYAQAHALPEAFRRDQEQLITLQWVRELLLFYPSWSWQRRLEASPPSLPAGYYDFMRELPLQQLLAQPTPGTREELLDLPYYYGLRLMPRGHLGTDPAEASQLYATATAELGATPARDRAIYQLLQNGLRDNLPGVEAVYPTFRAQNRDSSFARQLRQQLRMRRQLVPGQPAPDFALRDNTGKEISLRDLRGKVVYLDFWGTWCPPCMREMTNFSHALKQQFVGRDVVFVYISMYDTEEKWQQVLKEKNLTSANSVHLRAPDKAVAERYSVSSYPSYYLIGRDGRLLQPFTLRPSDGPHTVALIEAALAAPFPASARR